MIYTYECSKCEHVFELQQLPSTVKSNARKKCPNCCKVSATRAWGLVRVNAEVDNFRSPVHMTSLLTLDPRNPTNRCDSRSEQKRMIERYNAKHGLALELVAPGEGRYGGG